MPGYMWWSNGARLWVWMRKAWTSSCRLPVLCAWRSREKQRRLSVHASRTAEEPVGAVPATKTRDGGSGWKLRNDANPFVPSMQREVNGFLADDGFHGDAGAKPGVCACSVGCVTWCKKQGDAGVALVSRGRQHACVEALSVGSRVRINSEIKAMAAKHGETSCGALPLCKGEEECGVRART